MDLLHDSSTIGSLPLASLLHPYMGVQASHRDFVCIPSCRLVAFKGELLHATHRLTLFKGLAFCDKCGFYAANHARKLKFPCEVARGGDCTAQGKRNLARLKSSLPPADMYRWPNEDERGHVTISLQLGGGDFYPRLPRLWRVQSDAG